MSEPAPQPAQAYALERVSHAVSRPYLSVPDILEIAKAAAKSAIVPKAFQNKPDDVFVAMQLGVEVGLAPMQALQSIAVINGRPSLYGDGFLAVILTSDRYEDHEEYYEVNGQRKGHFTVPGDSESWMDEIPTLEELKQDTTAAICTFYRRGKRQPVTRRFSIGDARHAKTTVYDNNTRRIVPLLDKPGPWQDYPARMLSMRARSWAGRDCFADVLRGLDSAEEVRDIDPEAPAPVRELPRARRAAPAANKPPIDAAPADKAPTADPAAVYQPFIRNPEPAPPGTRSVEDHRADTRPLTQVDVTEGLEPRDTPAEPPAPAAPPVITVSRVEAKPYNNRTYYVVTFSDGRTASTWAPELADLASEAQRTQAPVRPTITEHNGKRKLAALAGV